MSYLLQRSTLAFPVVSQGPDGISPNHSIQDAPSRQILREAPWNPASIATLILNNILKGYSNDKIGR